MLKKKSTRLESPQDDTQQVVPKVVAVCGPRSKDFRETLLFLRERNVKLTETLLERTVAHVLLGKSSVRAYVDKVKKELKVKIDLDNELTTLARDRLRVSNPSAFASKEDMANARSLDP